MRELTEAASRHVALTPSLPPRVVALARAAGSLDIGVRTVWHLPSGWLPVDERDREDARKALSTFEGFLNPDAPFEGRTAEQARLGMILMLVAGTTTVAAGEEGAGAKLDLFEMALGDLPAWAIGKAVQRWVRREVPSSIEKAPNYSFTPPPQTIRALAKLEMAYAERAAAEARKVVALVSWEEARAEMVKAPGRGS